MSLVSIASALAPIVCLLALLVAMDSFKLLRWQVLAQALAFGIVAAVIALIIHAQLTATAGVPVSLVRRAIAPVVEELLKLAFIAYAIRRGRVGFPVDAAILGFAVGTGFALVENAYYLTSMNRGSAALWLVRGFGVALLHAATSAIAAIMSQRLAARRPGRAWRDFVPGALTAIALHAIYNQFVLPPVVATLVLLAALPPLILLVFNRSERATREWMSDGLDLDVELLQLVLSADFGHTRLGTYLNELRSRFPGPVVADMFCLMRVELELGIRAKGMLLAREAGLDMPVDEDTRRQLEEVVYLQKSIGPTGLLALGPLQVSGGRDVWQKFLLREQKNRHTNDR